MEKPIYTYEEFPDSDLREEGIREIPAPRDSLGVIGNYGVEYLVKDGYPLHMDLMIPLVDSDPERRWPLIAFVPGSGWMKQSLPLLGPMLARLAARGFVVAVVEYRPCYVSPFPAQIEDIKAAIRFLKLHAAEFSIDPEQVVLGGNSSGGHTVLIAGATGDSWPDGGAFAGVSASVKGIWDNYGPYDMDTLNNYPRSFHMELPDAPGAGAADKPVEEILAGERPMSDLAVHRFINADTELPPVLIVHGSKDRTVPFGQSVELYRYLKKLGKDVEMYRLQGGDHGVSTYWDEVMIDIYESFARRCLSRDGETV